ncbi:MAG: hypothetical protein QOI03_612 [Solirubrobacteraceae bacterium]|jgi:hypothetical protein|nr:hypothetical protein [Solirubrobacteraceae bacterium]
MKAPLRRAFIAPAPFGVLRFLLRPFGYLAFVGALAALSLAAKLLGERDELGFFSARLAHSMWRYPEVTRGGVQAAWLAWTALFVIALSPLDPIPSQWDEVVLAGLALLALYFRGVAAPRDGR